MRNVRILRRVLHETGAAKIWAGFIAFVLFSATVIRISEPAVGTWFDALWYCYAVVTTVGFGDIVVHSFLCRVLTVLLSGYAVLVIAIITGVIVNFFNEMVSLRNADTLASLMEKLENLPELSKEELEEISGKIRSRGYSIRGTHKKGRVDKM